MTKEEQKKADALEIAKRIRIDGDIKDRKKWYFMLIMPFLLLLAVYMDFENWPVAIGLIIVNSLMFMYRMWTWRMGNKKLELLILVVGLAAVVLAGIYFYHHNSFSVWSVLLVVTAFFTPMFIFRTLFVKQTNQIAEDLEEKYK